MRRNEQFVSLRNSQVPELFCAENIATEQLWWNFWPTWQVIFVTQFSPVHSFEIELHKESKKLYLSKCKFGPTFMPRRLRPKAIIFGTFPWIWEWDSIRNRSLLLNQYLVKTDSRKRTCKKLGVNGPGREELNSAKKTLTSADRFLLIFYYPSVACLTAFPVESFDLGLNSSNIEKDYLIRNSSHWGVLECSFILQKFYNETFCLFYWMIKMARLCNFLQKFLFNVVYWHKYLQTNMSTANSSGTVQSFKSMNFRTITARGPFIQLSTEVSFECRLPTLISADKHVNCKQSYHCSVT